MKKGSFTSDFEEYGRRMSRRRKESEAERRKK